MSKNDDQRRWRDVLLGILKKEMDTNFGRANLAGAVLLTLVLVIQITQSPIVQVFILISDTIKSCVLKQNISTQFEVINFGNAIIPLLLQMFLCFLFIGITENIKVKNNRRNKIGNKKKERTDEHK